MAIGCIPLFIRRLLSLCLKNYMQIYKIDSYRGFYAILAQLLQSSVFQGANPLPSQILDTLCPGEQSVNPIATQLAVEPCLPAIDNPAAAQFGQ